MALLAATGSIQAQQTQRVPDYCAMPAAVRPSLPAVLLEGMGKVDFAITTSSPRAQDFFNQGLTQLQGFWFVEAERSFLQAAAIDPNSPMVWWGVAASAAGDTLPAFQLPKRTNRGQPAPAAGSPDARAREASRKAVNLRGRATSLERLYIDAQAARRNPSAEDPDGDYIKAMRKLVAAFPEDLLAKSLLALALENGYHPITKRPAAGSLEAITLLRQVLSRDSNHLGANHYIVHAYEGGREPRTALSAAARLPALAPKIPHIVHMPGHIYVPTGRYDEAIVSFEATAALESEYIKRDVLNPTSHYAHNHHFLIHALGVDGRYEDAIRRANEMLEFKENPRERASVNGVSVYRDGWFALMKTLVRFEKWDLILDGKTLPVYEKPRERAWYHYARGLAQGAKGRTGNARQEYVAMRQSMDRLQEAAGWVPVALAVAMNELEGYARIKGNDDLERGLNLMRRAIQMEDAMPYTEPPAYPRPVREIFGRAMLDQKDFKVAETIYREALQREPGSGRALWGLTEALTGAGRTAEAALTRREFERVWGKTEMN